MFYREINSSPLLAEYVKCFWVWQSESRIEPHLPERILPDGCVELIFNLLDPIKLVENGYETETPYKSYIAGQIKTAIQIQPTGRVSLFGVRFHPASAYPILKYRLHEFTDRIIALDLVWGPLAREIESRILAAPRIHDKINIIERILLKRVNSGKHDKDHIVEASVNTILNRRGLVSIERLSNEISISRRQLEKKFKTYVGISPKLLARIIRFQHVVKIIAKNGSYDWPSIIFEYDYYDQSHLIKDFETLSGQNPSNYFKERHFLAENSEKTSS